MNRTLVVSVFALACLSACAGDSSGPQGDRYGRYTMRTINGKPLPAIVLETANARLEFLAGSVRLNADQTFTDSTELVSTPMYQGAPLPGGEVQHRNDVAWGLFRISGDTVYFDSLRGEHYYMVFQIAGPLVQELAGSRLVYTR
jgi:hypothetical protein